MKESPKVGGLPRWSGFGAVGAGFGLALSWLCCLPFAAALGAGIAAAGTALMPFQPLMAIASLGLLTVAMVQTVRGPRCEDDGSCTPLAPQRRWLFLAVVTLTTLLLITLPFWSSYFIYWSL